MVPPNDSNFSTTGSLGKGEVDSSILSGSTSKIKALVTNLPPLPEILGIRMGCEGGFSVPQTTMASI
jgi:hypothetical protein